MKIYWKVHIKNFDSFITFIIKKYKNIENYNNIEYFKSYYTTGEYLYLLIFTRDKGEYYSIGYTYCNYIDREWLEVNEYKNMGEYYGRKEKLNKLNKISKL